MKNALGLAMCWILVVTAVCSAQGRNKPAPPPSRYTYTFEVDAKSLPKGVKVREAKDPWRLFVSNESSTPLVIDERFQNKQLVAGTRLMDGKVYHYFPNGVPMEGKQHLKGWQAPFGDIPETILRLATEPEQIYAGRAPGLGRDLPKSEPFMIPANYDGKPYEISGTIHFHLNPEYDRHYAPRAEEK